MSVGRVPRFRYNVSSSPTVHLPTRYHLLDELEVVVEEEEERDAEERRG